MEKKHESDLTPAERRKERLETIRRLRGKARLEYIWEYYRFLLVFVIAAVLVISTAVTMIRNSRENIVLSIAVVDADKQTGQTNEELAEQIGLSRITIRRYTAWLTETGELLSSVDYQTGGRPSIRYRFHRLQ